MPDSGFDDASHYTEATDDKDQHTEDAETYEAVVQQEDIQAMKRVIKALQSQEPASEESRKDRKKKREGPPEADQGGQNPGESHPRHRAHLALLCLNHLSPSLKMAIYFWILKTYLLSQKHLLNLMMKTMSFLLENLNDALDIDDCKPGV